VGGLYIGGNEKENSPRKEVRGGLSGGQNGGKGRVVVEEEIEKL